jgi:hypothetical protein
MVSFGQGGSPVLLPLLEPSLTPAVVPVLASVVLLVPGSVVTGSVVEGSLVPVVPGPVLVEVPGSTVVVLVGLSVVCEPPVVGVAVVLELLPASVVPPLLLSLALPTSSGLQPASPRASRRASEGREAGGEAKVMDIGSL